MLLAWLYNMDIQHQIRWFGYYGTSSLAEVPYLQPRISPLVSDLETWTMRISETRILGPREISGEISEEVRALGFTLMNGGLRVNLDACQNFEVFARGRNSIADPRLSTRKPTKEPSTGKWMPPTQFPRFSYLGCSRSTQSPCDPCAAKDAEATLGRLVRIVKRILKERARPDCSTNSYGDCSKLFFLLVASSRKDSC